RAEARARVVRTGVAPLGEPAVTGEDRFFLRVLDREGRAAAVAGLADGERVLLGLAVAFAELADVRGGFSAFEALAGDHVDHAGDRVGTVDGRGAVLQDFHPVDGRHRDLAEILVAAGGRAQALAVDQHQGAVGAQVADVDVVTAHVLAGGKGLGAGDRRGAGRGQVLQHVGDGGEALLLDLPTAQRADRLLGLHVHAADARTGHFDAIE